MRRGIVAVSLWAGCYAPAIQPGTPCTTECPGGLVCVDRVCVDPTVAGDARTIDGPPGDVDADGIRDDVDNCATIANADQHDEDADALGDPCDPCPHIAGVPLDGDGDGVGDACDPRPADPGERFVVFDPFTSPRTEWDHGSATLVDGTLRMNGIAETSFSRLRVATGELRIATGGTIVSVDMAIPHQLAIAFGFDATGSRYHYAEFYDEGDGGAISLTEADGMTFVSLASIGYAGALPAGAWSMTIDESVKLQEMRLVARLDTKMALLVASTSTAPVLTTSDDLTILVKNADMRFDYFVVIESER